jgi:SAM-dependent methyltransferase
VARSLASRLWHRVRRAAADAATPGDGVPTIGDVDPRTLASDAPVAFRCNLCGSPAHATLAGLSRETPSCPRCGSTVRFRAIGRLVVRELLGLDAPLPHLAPRRDLVGLGLSDDASYAEPLARVFAYRNTFFHAEPRLDISAIDPSLRGRHDFVIASDVLEHVAPPVSRAFENALALLRPGGVFVMTVPFGLAADTVEHYPDLHDWSLESTEGAWRVVNRTADGRVQRFDAPVFHGGPGTTLEMRLFSRDALLREFDRAGFMPVRIADEPYLPFGIHWPEPWSVPIVARAPSPSTAGSDPARTSTRAGPR